MNRPPAAQLPTILPIGKSVIQLPPDENACLAFIDGMQAGHLACMAYWRGVHVTDTELVLLVVKQQQILPFSSFSHWGYLLGRFSTLARKGGVLLTNTSFCDGYREGVAAACPYSRHLLTLKELCTILSEQHGTNSAQHTGYVYGFIEGVTKGIHTVKPRIPGEEKDYDRISFFPSMMACPHHARCMGICGVLLVNEQDSTAVSIVAGSAIALGVL